MKVENFSKLFLSILICLSAGWIGSYFTISSIPGWYEQLAKPSLNPPSWVFGPVWTTLYVLMGIAAFLVWQQGLNKKRVQIALIVFAGQLALNVVWSVLFFGLHNPGWALVDIVLLWFAILATIFAFAKVSRSASWLLIPYILWVSFAIYLNYSIFILNR